MEVRSIRQLLQHEVGDIGARDLSFDRLIGAWKAVAIHAGTIPVREGSRANDSPVQAAFLDIVLLAYVICVRSTQEEPKHDVLPEEIQIGPTVPDAEG